VHCLKVSKSRLAAPGDNIAFLLQIEGRYADKCMLFLTIMILLQALLSTRVPELDNACKRTRLLDICCVWHMQIGHWQTLLLMSSLTMIPPVWCAPRLEDCHTLSQTPLCMCLGGTPHLQCLLFLDPYPCHQMTCITQLHAALSSLHYPLLPSATTATTVFGNRKSALA
jgi:hypothetical protein